MSGPEATGSGKEERLADEDLRRSSLWDISPRDLVDVSGQASKLGPLMDPGQEVVLRRLSAMGVARASQLGTTDDVLASLEVAGLAMPRRWHDPSVRLWQPTRRGDELAGR